MSEDGLTVTLSLKGSAHDGGLVRAWTLLEAAEALVSALCSEGDKALIAGLSCANDGAQISLSIVRRGCDSKGKES